MGDIKKHGAGREQDKKDVRYLKKLKHEKSKAKGFDYYLSDEVLRSCQKKPLELKLKRNMSTTR